MPSIGDPTFLRQIVFGSATASTTPAARFSYLFPTSDAGIIQVRLRAGLSDSQQQQAIGWIRAAVASPMFRLNGVSYTVTGEPVLLAGLGDEIGGQLVILLAVAVAVMALVLLVAFRRRLRLLPLAVAIAAVAITFGLIGCRRRPLTVAEVAVFPVLLGLGVDYGVQFRSGTPRGAIAIAALATIAGFVALLISPVPMVRGFGVLLMAGVAVALAVAAVCVPSGPGERLSAPRLPEAAARLRLRRRRDPARPAAGADPPAPSRAGGRARAGGRWLGARRAYGCAVGHHQAGAVRHAGAPAPRHARARHRCLRRGGRAGQCPRRHLAPRR